MLIVIALLVISVLILVHELGHFLAAKASGVWAEEFGIGLPPRLWGKKIGETIYSINALPFGGFVRMHGETADQKILYPERSFVGKSQLARIFIAVAGVTMNFILAISVFMVIFYFTGVARGVKVSEILPNSPAETSGILPGDQIVEINHTKIKQTEYFTEIVAQNLGQTVPVIISRDGEVKTLTTTFNSEFKEDQGALGVIYEPQEIYKPNLLLSPFVYGYYSTLKTIDYSNKILAGFGTIFSQLFSGAVPKGVTGPVGVTAVVAEFARLGLLPLLELVGIISINLALLNLIPFPPLDGSRVAFVLLESVVGKPNILKVENKFHTVGMAILLIIILLATINEVPKLIAAHSLSAFVNTIIQ